MTDEALCPCGSEAAYATCCEPIIEGKTAAPTAEALMRSRYSAFAKGKIDHIIQSHDPDTVGEIVREEVEAWSLQSSWLGLSVLRTERGQAEDDAGVVDFVAKYKLNGLTTQHRERAVFRRVDGKWLFVDGGEIPSEKQAPAQVKWVGKKKGKARRR
ncbi:MAG: SEC-C domain-containing protein [Polyangiaceae bacterium]|nr:SEC-C domain-containing protein [Polyangiaceae bacterium]MCW5791585.1 SEC-C domain-containing protein [Polyangiaceae bacterium]